MRTPEPRQLLWGLYWVLLAAFGVLSLISSWSADPIAILALEAYVDVTILAGTLLYIVGRRSRSWLVPVVVALVAQVYLVSIEPFPDLDIALLFLVLVAPGFAASLLVSRSSTARQAAA